jgi:tetratricopeptide (TPR) repeat protein
MKKYVVAIVLLFLSSSLFALNRDYRFDCNEDSAYRAYYYPYCVEHVPSYPNWLPSRLVKLIPATGPQCHECYNPSIYIGYIDPDFRKYRDHLQQQLEYCSRYKNCTCYWPEYCPEAAQISDTAYLLFNDLILTTALSNFLQDEKEQRKFIWNRGWFLNEHGLTLAFIIQQFRFSHYYEVCQDISEYARSKFDIKESAKIQSKIASILESLSPLFFSLYSKCLSKHPNAEIEQELLFLKLFTSGGVLNDKFNNIIHDNDANEFSSLDEVMPRVFSVQSEILLEQGTILNNLLSYPKAIEVLTESIRLNHLNINAYIERATAYFETRQFDLAIEDYKKIQALKKSILASSRSVLNKDHLFAFLERANEFVNDQENNSNSFIKGLDKGLTACLNDLEEFVPSLCYSICGMGKCLWIGIHQPVDSLNLFYYACYETCESTFRQIKKLDKERLEEVSDIWVDEFKTLYGKYEQLSQEEKGRLFGFIIGKYGLDLFIGSTSVEAINACKNLKRANKICNLEVLASSKVNRQGIEKIALEQVFNRENFFKNIKIEWDKQNKHIVGRHNYQVGKSIFEHPDPQSLINKLAGKGKPMNGEIPGNPNYRELVDFGEDIGIWKDKDGKFALRTTKGIIHYSKQGAHIIPAHPDSKIW